MTDADRCVGLVELFLGQKLMDGKGGDLFRGWLKSQELDLALFRGCVEEVAANKKANPFVTVTLGAVRELYAEKWEALHGERPEAAEPPPEHCHDCQSTGVVLAVVAGDDVGAAKIVPTHRKAPWCYMATTTIPCVCAHGDRRRELLAARGDGKKRFIWTKERVQRIWGTHVWPMGRGADEWIRQCRAMGKPTPQHEGARTAEARKDAARAAIDELLRTQQSLPAKEQGGVALDAALPAGMGAADAGHRPAVLGGVA